MAAARTVARRRARTRSACSCGTTPRRCARSRARCSRRTRASPSSGDAGTPTEALERIARAPARRRAARPRDAGHGRARGASADRGGRARRARDRVLRLRGRRAWPSPRSRAARGRTSRRGRRSGGCARSSTRSHAAPPGCRRVERAARRRGAGIPQARVTARRPEATESPGARRDRAPGGGGQPGRRGGHGGRVLRRDRIIPCHARPLDGITLLATLPTALLAMRFGVSAGWRARASRSA